jgi:transketolase
MRNTFINSLQDAAKQDERIILIVGDLGYGVVDEFQKELPNQFMNFGINEQSMMSAAAGLALEGYRPFVYSIGNFPTLRCLEQIRNDVCFMNLPVTFVAVGAGFSYGSSGYSHHLIEDISILRGLPNLRIYAPTDTTEVMETVLKVIGDQKPAYVRLGKGGEEELQSLRKDSTFGVREYFSGEDGLILFTSTIGSEVITAAKLLQSRGIFPTVRSLSYVEAEVARSLFLDSKFKFIMTVEEHIVSGGFGSFIREILGNLPIQMQITVLGVSKLQERETGDQGYLRKIYGLDAYSIADKFEQLNAISKNS